MCTQRNLPVKKYRFHVSTLSVVAMRLNYHRYDRSDDIDEVDR